MNFGIALIHYNPFGLTMAGISSHASGKMQNRDKTFQGQKFDDDLGINYDEFKWRNHDPQIGRFIEIDPLSDKYVYNSTYAFSEDKVVAHIELEGLESRPINSSYAIPNHPFVSAFISPEVTKPLSQMAENINEGG